MVYLAVREVPKRFMTTRVEPKFEAELRALVGDRYETQVCVRRSTRDTAIEAARAYAQKRGWRLDEKKRLGWNTWDAALERAIAEEARDLFEGTPKKPAPPKKKAPPPMLLTEFFAELHDLLLEARRKRGGMIDKQGRDVARYYGETMRRLEEAVDVVNDRICQRGGLRVGEAP